MQVCNSLQTDIHASTQFFTGRMQCLPPEKKISKSQEQQMHTGKINGCPFFK